MTITIDPKVETGIPERAEVEGLTVSAYIERLVRAEKTAEEVLDSLALGGLNSRAPIEVGPGYGEEKRGRLGERLLRSQEIE